MATTKPIPPCRILSVRQPWAWAICEGIKEIENRSWASPFQGVVFIHAGLKIEEDGIARLRDERGFKVPRSFRTGAVIGAVALEFCLDLPELSREDFEEAETVLESSGQILFAKGPVLWVLTRPAFLSEPVPMKGRLGLWQPDPELARRLFDLLPTRSPLRKWRPRLVSAGDSDREDGV